MANLTLSLLMVSPSNHEGSDDGPALSVLFTRARPATPNGILRHRSLTGRPPPYSGDTGRRVKPRKVGDDMRVAPALSTV